MFGPESIKTILKVQITAVLPKINKRKYVSGGNLATYY
jgi:hypothetical protein